MKRITIYNTTKKNLSSLVRSLRICGYDTQLVKVDKKTNSDSVATAGVLLLEVPSIKALEKLIKQLELKPKNLGGKFVFAMLELDNRTLPLVSKLPVDDVVSPKVKGHELIFRIQQCTKLKKQGTKLKQVATSLEEETTVNEIAIKQREEFLGICAHDLRSPMGLISSSLSLILNQNRNQLPDTVVEFLKRMKRQANHCINLVNDLLDVMAYEQGLRPSFELVDLHQFLGEFHSDYRMLSEEKGIRFLYDNSVKDWKVLMDGDRIRQLLQNLYTNAVKFTGSGKSIYLMVTPFKGRRKSDPIYPMIIVSLKDEGDGIPKNEIEKIFDKFSQLKDYSRTEGRGLGLSVAKQISKNHGGNVWVDSKEGVGSTFHVLVPYVLSRAPGQVTFAKRHVPHILVCEPSDENRKRKFKVLRDWGYNVTFVGDGAAAAATAYYMLPDYLILTQPLDKMNELETANFLKAEPRTSHIPVLLLADKNYQLKSEESEQDWMIDSQFSAVPADKDQFETRLIEAGQVAASRLRRTG